MKFLKAASLAAAIFFVGNASAWTLIYSADASGNATVGSVQALRNAIVSGASVKVLSGSLPYNASTVICNQIAMNSDQTIVCVGATVDLMQDIAPGAKFGTPLVPLQNSNVIINTQGQYAETRTQKSNSAVVYRQTTNIASQWFVE